MEFVGWAALGSGVLIMYSLIKGENPWSVITGALTGSSPTSSTGYVGIAPNQSSANAVEHGLDGYKDIPPNQSSANSTERKYIPLSPVERYFRHRTGGIQ